MTGSSSDRIANTFLGIVSPRQGRRTGTTDIFAFFTNRKQRNPSHSTRGVLPRFNTPWRTAQGPTRISSLTFPYQNIRSLYKPTRASLIKEGKLLPRSSINLANIMDPELSEMRYFVTGPRSTTLKPLYIQLLYILSDVESYPEINHQFRPNISATTEENKLTK